MAELHSDATEADPSVNSLQTATESGPVPSLQWRLIDACNYRCEYCGEGRYDPKKPTVGRMSDELAECILGLTADLPGTWRVMFGSGESTLDPRLVGICRSLVDQGHMVALTTNFSMSTKKQKELVEACGDRLEYVHASLHLYQVSVPEFLERAVHFNSIKSAQTSFEIATLMKSENFDFLRRLHEEFTELGLNLKFQFQRDNTGYYEYEPEIEEFMRTKAFQWTFQLRGKNFRGKLCHAGRLFFIIERNGDCFRCFGMRTPWSYMGSIAKGTFRRFDEPKPCLSKRCQCLIVPRRRLLVPRSGTSKVAQVAHALECSLRGWRFELDNLGPRARNLLLRTTGRVRDSMRG